MNDIGSTIKELRIQAGYTQKTLAEALHITDKAISKWERGICLPDMALLPKLALLLDVDTELLIANKTEENECVGLIDIPDCDFAQTVYDKPLIYYLLSHFLLLGITSIHVLSTAENTRYLESEVFRELGFVFCYDIPENQHTMIINHPWFLFGSDLTQQFRGAILSGRNIKLVPENQEPVALFSRGSDAYFKDKKRFVRSAAPKTLGRGMVCFDMSDSDKILEVASFVKAYQKNSGLLIGSLEEIAFRRGTITVGRLGQMASQVPYEELLRRVMSKPQVD